MASHLWNGFWGDPFSGLEVMPEVPEDTVDHVVLLQHANEVLKSPSRVHIGLPSAYSTPKELIPPLVSNITGNTVESVAGTIPDPGLEWDIEQDFMSPAQSVPFKWIGGTAVGIPSQLGVDNRISLDVRQESLD